MGTSLMLQVLDTLLVRHLTALDELRQGIGLRAYGQQDPWWLFKKMPLKCMGNFVRHSRGGGAENLSSDHYRERRVRGTCRLSPDAAALVDPNRNARRDQTGSEPVRVQKIRAVMISVIAAVVKI